MLLQEIINTAFQLGLALLVSGVAWAALGRKSAGFRVWLGLTTPPAGAMQKSFLIWLGFACLSIPLLLFGPMGDLASGPGTVGGKLADIGSPAMLAALIVLMACIKTALTEEIVFRGLIAKRLIAWLGFRWGNLVQALLFGSVHLLLFAAPGAPAMSPANFLAVLGMPSLAGWLMGFANERYGAGSIAPGWLIHACGNLVGYTITVTYLT